MSVGQSILSLLGNRDPREALLQAIAAGSAPNPAASGGAGGVPYADGAAAGGGGQQAPTAGGAGVQAQAATEATKSPPDLAAMYSDLLKYNSREQNINRGFGLIGSSISQDGNREATLGAFAGGRPEGDRVGMSDIASTMVSLNKADIARQQRAAMMAKIPAIAKRYGIDPDTAAYLYDTGELDKLITEAEKPNSELRDLGNGQVALIDKTAGNQRAVFGDPKTNNQIVDDPAKGKTVMDLNAVTPGTVVAGPDNRTGDTKNYEYYEAQEKAAGRTPLSFNEWDMQNRAKSNPNGGLSPEEQEFRKKRGQNLGEKYVNIQNAADSALEQLTMYDAVEKGIETGVRTGALGESEQSLRKFGQMLGLDTDPNKIAGGELVTAIQNRMALQMRNPESGMGMPGSLSDKDIEFLKAAQIGMGTSESGNKTLLDVYRRLAKRKIELADLADRHADEFGSLRGFNQAATKFNEENPLFGDLVVQGNTDPKDAAAREKMLLDKYTRTGK